METKVTSVIRAYVDALNSNNADQVANLFSADGIFNDGALRQIDMADMYGQGRAEIKAIFENLFKDYFKTVMMRLNPNSMEYDVFYKDYKLPCVGAFTLDADYKIKELCIRPR